MWIVNVFIIYYAETLMKVQIARIMNEWTHEGRERESKKENNNKKYMWKNAIIYYILGCVH